MSARANYAIVEGGKVGLFLSPAGAPTVPRDLRGGPTMAEAFIRKQQPAGHDWEEFSRMEGGAVLDKDRRAAMLFGGPPEINYDRRVSARYLEEIAPVWAAAGWTVEWAPLYAYDLVRFAGLSPTLVETPGELDLRARTEASPVGSVSDGEVRCLVGLKEEKPRLRISGAPAAKLVESGDAVVGLIPKMERLDALAPEAQDAAVKENVALLFDPARRRLELVAPVFATFSGPPFALLERTRERFPEWIVTASVEDRPVRDRLRLRGYTSLPGAPVATDTRSAAEIDAIVERCMAFSPEPANEELKQAAESALRSAAAPRPARKKKAPRRKPAPKKPARKARAAKTKKTKSKAKR